MRACVSLMPTLLILKDFSALQATGDLSRLAETLGDYISLLASVKEVFTQRTKLYHQWQTQNAHLMKKRSWLQGQRYNASVKNRSVVVFKSGLLDS